MRERRNIKPAQRISIKQHHHHHHHQLQAVFKKYPNVYEDIVSTLHDDIVNILSNKYPDVYYEISSSGNNDDDNNKKDDGGTKNDDTNNCNVSNSSITFSV